MLRPATSDAQQRIAEQRALRVRSASDVSRMLLGAGVMAGVILLMVSAWLGRWYTVSGSSMADTILGPHARISCECCGREFAAGYEGATSLDRPAVCPNCGDAQQCITADRVVAGDVVLVDRSAYRFRLPRRWEVAALRAPNTADTVCVKRVVGLPGERIKIVAGDVYVDGAIARKDLAQQRALAVLVHDNDSLPPAQAGCPPHWQSDSESRWSADGSEFVYPPAPAVQDRAANEQALAAIDIRAARELDWLTYSHWLRGSGTPVPFAAEPILDTHGYNQTYPVIDPQHVSDLLLSFQVSVTGAGTLYLLGDYAGEEWRCAITHDGRAELRRGDQCAQKADWREALAGRTRQIEFSFVDRRVLLAIDGAVWLDYPMAEPRPIALDETAVPDPRACRPLAIASDGLAVRISHLRLYRDVYYVAPEIDGGERQAEGGYPLAEDEFFVLSDNSRRGHDSRHATFGPAVAANLFVGKPLIGCESVGWPAWAPAGIQVPTPQRIRYIR